MKPFTVSVAAAALLVACENELPVMPGGGPATNGNARAYGLWVPGPRDNCSQAIHDQYAVTGPDGKRYPTWHPPTDPVTNCSFGHDHGRDPAGSDLYRQVGPIPFGYANEQLELYDPANPRNEDHFGHKVEWENDVRLNFGSDAADRMFDIRCDVLTKLHQGTHSRDAFTNNLHELVYHISCSDGTEMHVTLMSAIGDPGQFTRTCDGATIVVGPPTPANSPQGGGQRRIPDRFCVDQQILVAPGASSNFFVLNESWETSNLIRRADGHVLAHFNPYYQVRLPSRYHDPNATNVTARPIDLCYEVTADGRLAQGSACTNSTAGGTILGLTYDDPQSVFDGSRRVVDINDNDIDNAAGPTVWFTDPFGRQGSPAPFTGSIRQWIAKMDNGRGGLNPSGPTLGGNRTYGDPRVHAPN